MASNVSDSRGGDELQWRPSAVRLHPCSRRYLAVTSTGGATSTAGQLVRIFPEDRVYFSANGGAGVNFLTAKFTNAVFSGSGNSGVAEFDSSQCYFHIKCGLLSPPTMGMSLCFRSFILPIECFQRLDCQLRGTDSGTFSAARRPCPSPAPSAWRRLRLSSERLLPMGRRG